MAFPTLEVLSPIESPPPCFTPPVKKINDGPDVTRFLSSKAYRDIGIFILQLNRSVVPRKSVTSPSGAQTFPLPQTFNPLVQPAAVPENEVLDTAATATTAVAACGGESGAGGEDGAGGHIGKSETRIRDQDGLPASIKALQELLDRIRAYIAEAPPDPGPRRFGNISFRKWHALLGERTPALLDELIPSNILNYPSAASEIPESRPKDEIEAYLLGAFGSPQRLDYGTGHELSFLAFLGCLWKLDFFSTAPGSSPSPTAVSRHIVLSVIEPYLAAVRTLITTYTLEPAGSHGVWGLDDHSFLPYVFGSAQFTRPITEEEATPLEGSVRGAPRTGDIVKNEAVERWRASNMYFSAVGFINDVKNGPFWEHSPILFDISGVRDGWGKINKGMIKMFNAEVLSKFPVIQHFPFGSLFSWDLDPDSASSSDQSVHIKNQPPAFKSHAGTSTRLPPTVGTAAPWAQTTTMPPLGQAVPGMPATRAPWATGPRTSPRSGGTGLPSMARPPPPDVHTGTTAAQITVTKAPWARNG